MTEHRGPYRIHTERPFLRAVLRAAGQPELRGAVVDLSARGAGVVFTDVPAAALAPGCEVEVRLESLLLRHPIQVRACVRRWVDGDEESRCAVEFAGAGIPDEQIPFVLRREFNRRAAPRVSVTEFVEVLVQARAGGPRIRAALVDLSRDGMRVTASEADALQMTGWRELEVAFALPDRDGVVRLPALVRSYDEKDVGLAFDLDDADDHARHFPAIDAFVQARLAASRPRTRRPSS